MNIWIRVSSKLDIETDGDGVSGASAEIKTGLQITVYAAKANAKEAQQEVGGVIFEVEASCLANIESLFGKDVSLSCGTDGEGKQPSSAYMTVCYDGLDSKEVPNYGDFEPGTVEPQGEVAEFGPTAMAWIVELEKETGFSLHQ
jgi:hypothetical protein